VGNGKQGEHKTQIVTVTLPVGLKSYLVVVAATSDEYPQFTGYQSEYDDVLEWNILGGGGIIQGSTNVNKLDDDWKKSENDGAPRSWD
jgi:hypothetical protein